MEIWTKLTFATIVSGKTLTEIVDVEKANVDSTIRTYKKFGWDLTAYHHIGRKTVA